MDNYILVPSSLKKFQKLPRVLENTKIGSLVYHNDTRIPSAPFFENELSKMPFDFN